MGAYCSNIFPLYFFGNNNIFFTADIRRYYNAAEIFVILILILIIGSFGFLCTRLLLPVRSGR